MDSLLAYALPSISAIAIKIILLWRGASIIRSAGPWVLCFLGGLLGVNICELLAFMFSGDASKPAALFILVFYYVFASISNTGFIGISFKLAGLTSKKLTFLLLPVSGVGLLSILIPNAAIAGVQSIGYSLTRIPGPFYWVFQVITPLLSLLASGALVYSACRSQDWVSRRRALALLFGSCPAIAATAVVMILMHSGIAINASVIVSLAINVLLGVLIYTEYESGVFRFLSYIPRTQEYRLISHATQSAYQLGSLGLGEAVTDFERALVADALSRCRGNKSEAAKLLGVSRTTLRRKLY